MITIKLVLGENDKKVVLERVKDIIGSTRGMLEIHRQKEDAKISNRFKKLLGTYQDKSGQLMADIISCCWEIDDNIAEDIYDSDPGSVRLASDIAELAHLVLQFFKETEAHWDVFAASFNIYKEIISILKEMVIENER